MRYYLPITTRLRTVNRYLFNKLLTLNTDNIGVLWTSSYGASSSILTPPRFAWYHTNNIIYNLYHYLSTIDNNGTSSYLTFLGVAFPTSSFELDENRNIHLNTSSFYILQPYNYTCEDGIEHSDLSLYNNSSTYTLNEYFQLIDSSGVICGVWLDSAQSLLFFYEPSGDVALSITVTSHINLMEIYCIVPASLFNYTSNLTSFDEFKNRRTSFTNPYMTSIGLYNDHNLLLALAKFSHPVRKSNKIDMIFNIQFDFT